MYRDRCAAVAPTRGGSSAGALRLALAGGLVVLLLTPAQCLAAASRVTPTSVAPETLSYAALHESPLAFVPAGMQGGSENQLIGFVCGDFDGDSWDELVTAFQEFSSPQLVSLVYQDFPSGLAHTTQQVNLSDLFRIRHEPIGDLDGDGSADIGIAFRRDSQAWGGVYGTRGHLIYHTPILTGPDIDHTGDWDGHVMPVLTVDLDRDGRAELLSTVTAAFDRQPRGLIAHDVARHRELWFFHCGALVDQVIALSDPRTGEPLLLVSTCAVMNGSDEGGYPDDQAYLFLLDARGRVLQTASYGGRGAKLGLAVADIDGDALPEALIAINSNFQLPGCTYGLLILDPFSFAVEGHIDPGTFLAPPVVTDLDGDGRPEIITWRGDAVFVFGPHLELEREVFAPGPIRALLPADLDGDTRPELTLALQGSGRLFAVNGEGRLLASEQVTNEPLDWLAALRWGPRKSLLYAFNSTEGIALRLQPAPPGMLNGAGRGGGSPWTRGRILALLLAGLAAGGLAGMMITRAALGSGTRHAPSGARAAAPAGVANEGTPLERTAQLRAALVQLTTFGHGEPGALIGRAATLLQGARDDLVRDPEWRHQVAECCMALRTTIIPLLHTSVASRAVLVSHGHPPERIIGRFRDITQETDRLMGQLGEDEVPDPAGVRAIGRSLFAFDTYRGRCARVCAMPFAAT